MYVCMWSQEEADPSLSSRGSAESGGLAGIRSPDQLSQTWTICVCEGTSPTYIHSYIHTYMQSCFDECELYACMYVYSSSLPDVSQWKQPRFLSVESLIWQVRVCMYVCMYVCRDVCYLVRKVLCMYVLMYVCIFSRVRRRGVDPRVATYPESEARSNDYE